MPRFKTRRAQRRHLETQMQTATHNKSKNSIWTRGAHLTLDREEGVEKVEEEEEEEREGE